LLSAIETCKEYKNILLGYHQPIIVFTDHKNNTFNGLKALDRIWLTCWLLLLEEYGVTFEYLAEKKNVGTVADALSRLDIDILKNQKEGIETSILFHNQDLHDLHSSLIERNDKEYCPGTMNIYFIRDRLEQKRLSGIP
jgi:hypothetical protein